MYSSSKKYYLTSKIFTVQVETNGSGKIVDGAPVIHKFIGQPLDNLLKWLNTKGGYDIMRI